MSSRDRQPDELVSRLNSNSLLDLAASRIEAPETPPRFNLPTPDQLQPQFPELAIGEMIGSGGMGCVYRARQIKLDRVIALKVLPTEPSDDSLFTERFAREARAMARLHHPGIVGIHDFGSVANTHYLVLEYLDGSNLRELQNAGPLDFTEAVQILAQICSALGYAHSEGVVHRDIKPENILFDQSGRVVLADFGLARLVMDSNAPISLTQTRQALGTLNYMAPEQWENPRSVDHRADIYALGVLLYEMLTGRIPRGSFPPASSLVDLPPALDDVVNRSLQLDADDRYQSVVEFADALRAAATGSVKQRPLDFAEHGTVTNFRNLGAALINRIPRPAPAVSADSRGAYSHAKVGWFFFAVCTGLMLAPWKGRHFGFTLMTNDFLDLSLDVSNSVMLVEIFTVCLLCSLERQLHPVRVRVISLIMLGLCIAQIAYFLFENSHSGENLTGLPFVFFLAVCLFTAEWIIRCLHDLQQHAQRSMVWAYRLHQQKDASRKRERSERLQKWIHYWSNRFQR